MAIVFKIGAPLIALALCLGCEPESEPTSSNEADAATPALDAQPAPVMDADAPPDAALQPSQDGGQPEPDAASPMPDVGLSAPDVGLSAPDAVSPAPDAGQSELDADPPAPVADAGPVASDAAAVPVDQGVAMDDDLRGESDEFDDGANLRRWARLMDVEEWPNDQLETFDVNVTRAGWMTMIPHSSAWYGDYRGVLAFKRITGDFVATTHVEVRSRAGEGAPAALYSLGGLMVRTPREVTPATWTPGGENYAFLSIGTGDVPRAYRFEVKTTVDSRSRLSLTPASSTATIRLARVGTGFIILVRGPGSPWRVHQRYDRPDMPATLQVGLTAYTDWDTVEATGVAEHNTMVLAGQPDLVAQFDYLRLGRPAVPEDLRGADLTDAAVDDARLLEFLGDSADAP